jgi:hypothetical protein
LSGSMDIIAAAMIIFLKIIGLLLRSKEHSNMDKYRRVNKWWEDKDRECAFCHSKLSVKYDVLILASSNGKVKDGWVSCCNECVLRYAFGAE